MTVNTVSEVQTAQTEPERERRIFSMKTNQAVWLFLSLSEALLALRFVLKLKEDKPITLFAAVLYGFTGFFRMRIFQL